MEQIEEAGCEALGSTPRSNTRPDSGEGHRKYPVHSLYDYGIGDIEGFALVRSIMA